MGRKTGERKGQLEELVDDRSAGAMEKSRYIKVIEREEIRRDDPREKATNFLKNFKEAVCCVSAVVQGAARRKNGLCEGSALGNWTLGKANSHFDPAQTGSGTAPSR